MAHSLVAALITAVGVAVLTAGGISISPDSEYYMAAADSLLAGRGFHTAVGHGPRYDGVFVAWPPLYPVLLAALRSVGLEMAAAARMVNVLVAAALAGALATYTGRLRWLAVALLFVSVPLWHVFAYAWTEPLFTLLVLLFLVFIDKEHWRTAAVVVALACLTRYIGVTLIATGVLVLLYRRLPLRSVTAFMAVSALPVTLWLMRNYALTGTLVGKRLSSSVSLVDNVVLVASTLALWIVPLFLLPLVLMVLRRGMLPLSAVPLLFVGVYLAFLLYSASSVAMNAIDTRLLSPVYVPLLVACLRTIPFLQAARASTTSGPAAAPPWP